MENRFDKNNFRKSREAPVKSFLKTCKLFSLFFSIIYDSMRKFRDMSACIYSLIKLIKCYKSKYNNKRILGMK